VAVGWEQRRNLKLLRWYLGDVYNIYLIKEMSDGVTKCRVVYIYK